MHLSAIKVRNFRNFQDLRIDGLSKSAVIVGENNVGKSNLLHAIRLILDPALPDTARRLEADDFWDGLASPFGGNEIEIAVEIAGFDGDTAATAVLGDAIVAVSPFVARLTYLFRPAGGAPTPAGRDDYEVIVYAGTKESNRIRAEARRLVSVHLMPALRDAETELASWTRSPLKALLERLAIDATFLEGLMGQIQTVSGSLVGHQAVADLGAALVQRLADLGGRAYGPSPTLGIGASRTDEVLRAVRLFVENGRSLGTSGLGASNLIFLALLMEVIAAKKGSGEVVSTILAVEEPEAHLHPHLQRVLFRHLLRTEPAIVVTTHSTQIASVAPLASLVLLRREGTTTVAKTTAAIDLDAQQIADLERYVDAVRADFLFARGVILVEGPSELYLLPAIAESMGHDLDALGIAVCGVHGVDFGPYIELLGPDGLDIPLVVITDGDLDPDAKGRVAAGLRRAVRLIVDGTKRDRLSAYIDAQEYGRVTEDLKAESLYVGTWNVEADIAVTDPDAMIDTRAEFGGRTATKDAFRDNVRAAGTSANDRRDLVLEIERWGKGRFAQRLRTRMDAAKSPAYLTDAIDAILAKVP